jgi:hypothetical protein
MNSKLLVKSRSAPKVLKLYESSKERIRKFYDIVCEYGKSNHTKEEYGKSNHTKRSVVYRGKSEKAGPIRQKASKIEYLGSS